MYKVAVARDKLCNRIVWYFRNLNTEKFLLFCLATNGWILELLILDAVLYYIEPYGYIKYTITHHTLS